MTTESSTLDKDSAKAADTTVGVTATMDNLKIDATTTEVTAAPSDVSSVQTPRFDIDAVPKKWSPEHDRDERTANGNVKYLPYDAETNFLCGGDFVLNEKGEAATISFLFLGEDGKKYGLTVAHLAPSIAMGSQLFTYHTNDSFIKIGRVKQFAHQTDSLIFELEPDIKADFYKIRLADNTKYEIDLSTSVRAMKTLVAGKTSGGLALLVGRGAQRRGTDGQYSSTWNYPPTPHVLTGDIGMNSIGTDDDGMKELTHEGDCGMIIMDKNGDALCMHHAGGEAEVDGNIVYESFSVPLCRIMKVHAAYFPNFVPEDDDDYLFMTTSPQQRTSRPIPQIRGSFFDKEKPFGFIKSSRGRRGGK